ncbi:MAG: serine/threonine-protein kinase [Acidobacteriota bacterium]
MDLLDKLPGQILDGKYRIDKKLGQGGMGAVYLAVHLGTARPVALKVITPRFMQSEEFVARFKREAKAAGLLRHPNIVNVTDFGFASVGADSVAYLVMEYLDGCPLSDILKEEKQLQLNWVIDIVEQVCLAIDRAHKYGIVHRDLKPDNIWLEPNERGGYRVKVLDFGLAKVIDAPQEEETQADSEITLSFDTETRRAIKPPPSGQTQTDRSEKKTQVIEAKTIAAIDADEIAQTEIALEGKIKEAAELTQAGAILGTPVYMSPEQCLGAKLDARSDIYSLGVITYEMLAGQPPFKGNLYNLMAQHVKMPPPPLRQHRPDLGKSAEELLMSTLAKSPDDRPRSAAAFAHALRARGEGAGAILHRAFSFYGVNLPVFLRLSFLANLPLLAIVMVWTTGRLLDSLAPGAASVFDAVEASLEICGQTLSWLIGIGLFVPVVAQLTITPLRPVRAKHYFKIFSKRIRLIKATLVFMAILLPLILYQDYLFGFLGEAFRDATLAGKLLRPTTAGVDAFGNQVPIIAIAFVIPVMLSLRAALSYVLYAPVIVMEECPPLKSFARSKALVSGARNAAMIILAIFALFICLDNALFIFIEGYLVEIDARPTGALLAGISSRLLVAAGYIVFKPLIVVSLALLYFKARQSAGEAMEDILGNYQQEELPSAKWQERMMKRLSVRISSASKT